MNDLHKIQMCGRLMYNFTNHILPRSLSNVFITNANVHAHDTRQRDDPHVSTRKTSFLSQAFVHQGPKLWMDLPTDIKQAFTLKNHSLTMSRIISLIHLNSLIHVIFLNYCTVMTAFDILRTSFELYIGSYLCTDICLCTEPQTENL